MKPFVIPESMPDSKKEKCTSSQSLTFSFTCAEENN